MKVFVSSRFTSLETPEVIHHCNDSPASQSKIEVDTRLKPHVGRSSLASINTEETGHSENGMFTKMDRNAIFKDFEEPEITKARKVRRDTKVKARESFTELKAAGDSRRHSNQGETKGRGSRVPKRGSNGATRGEMGGSTLPPKANSHSAAMRASSRRQLLARSTKSQGALLPGAKKVDKDWIKKSVSHDDEPNQRLSRRMQRGQSRKDLAIEEEPSHFQEVIPSPNTDTKPKVATRRCSGKKKTHQLRGNTPRVSTLEAKARSSRRASPPEEVSKVDTKARSNRRSSAPEEVSRGRSASLITPKRGSTSNLNSRKELDLSSLASLQRRSTRNLMVDPEEGPNTSRLLQRGNSCRGLANNRGMSQRKLCPTLAETLNMSWSLLNNSMITPKHNERTSNKNKKLDDLDDDVESVTDVDFNDSAHSDLLSIASELETK